MLSVDVVVAGSPFPTPRSPGYVLVLSVRFTCSYHLACATVRHLGQNSSALRSELSLGHFGTSADLSGQFGPTKLVPKCPGSEVSLIGSEVSVTPVFAPVVRT